MSLLIESIKLLDGEYRNLFYHEQRMNKALKTLCGVNEAFDLENYLARFDQPTMGLFKCRIVYDDRDMDVEFIPYEYKLIQTLKVVEHDRISYEFKYKDRKNIDRLFELRKECDDVLIVKRKMVTDASYCNIVFRKGRQWFTPWSPLLKGTQRQKLIDHNMIIQEEIRLEDISSFDSWKLINAMWEFDAPEHELSKIIVK